MQDSPTRYLLHYRRGARLAHKPTDGPLNVGLHCGYAVTFFANEEELRKELTHFQYSKVIKRNEWKVGTAEITAERLDEMNRQWKRMDLKNPSDIWLPYDRPYEKRISKYQGDTKAEVAGHCEFMNKAIKHYYLNGKIAFLMIPLIHAFAGGIEPLERHLSWMITKAGGDVINDKNKTKEKKERSKPTRAKIEMVDGVVDKLLPLPPALKKLGFLTHPEQK